MNKPHHIEAFDTSLQKTYSLIKDIAADLQWEDLSHQAYGALRAVLHALRDRLTVEESAHLAAQLPMLVRGFYYEGWKPAQVPKKMHLEEFLNEVRSQCTFFFADEPADLVKVVFKNLRKHIDPGEMAHVKNTLPKDIRELIADVA